MSENNNILNEPDQNAYFEKAELDQLRDALKRTYAERFNMMAELMKMNLMFRKAKITHKPLNATGQA
ncbi:hypothetical protein GWC95_02920 [Sediminibacterium roseum]|uniref:50S ribosomal protein L29 n=1 Tax=Sediminibacterium roseum TaxID=1978412 RepID=A0ABW9ZP58_9BACT|nr:hypothetical protein [Sediminibacterium roseum]NCI48858.1 hypothetical protein [Sediminibacterium roseum]